MYIQLVGSQQDPLGDWLAALLAEIYLIQKLLKNKKYESSSGLKCMCICVWQMLSLEE